MSRNDGYGLDIGKVKFNTIFLLLSVLGLVINYFLLNDLLAGITTAVVAINMICCKEKNIVSNYIFVSFFSMLFQYQGVNLFAFIGIAVTIRLLLIKPRFIIRIILLHSIYIILHSFALEGHITFGFLIPSFLVISLYSCCVLFNSLQRIQCINSFIAGIVLSSFVGLFRAFSVCRMTEVFLDDRVNLGNSEGLIRYAGLAYDCNFYAVLVLIGIILILFPLGKGTVSKFAEYFCFIILSVFGTLTFSKSFILSMIGLLLIWCFRSGIKKVYQIIFTMCALLVAYIVMSDSFNEIVREILIRFALGVDINMLTTGRIQIWGYYWTRYVSSLKSILLGNGFSDHGYWKATHNLFLEILFDYGVVGFICDLVYILLSKKQFYNNTRAVRSIGGTLIVALFWLEQFFLSSYTTHSLTICVLLTFIARSEDDVEYNVIV